MIACVQTSLFVSPARTLVNTVNTVGVMGKGIAKVFRDVYPEMFTIYKERCGRGEIAPGVLQLYRTPHKSVLNLPAKRHWRQPSHLEDVEAGLRTFVGSHVDLGLTSVAFPQLGCGNGGLDWERQVRPQMERYLAPLPIDVYVHVPAADGKVGLPAGWDDRFLHRWIRGEQTPVPFHRFCSDLVATIGRDRMGAWRIDMAEDRLSPGLLWIGDGAPAALASDERALLWRRLPAFGLHSPADVSADNASLAEATLALLSGQPYLDRVVWATNWADLGSVGPTGLLFLPPSESVSVPMATPRQSECFVDTAVA